MNSVLILTPGNNPVTRDLDSGTTVGEVLDAFVDEGMISDPSEIKILNDRSGSMSSGDAIGDNRAINFITTLAGA